MKLLVPSLAAGLLVVTASSAARAQGASSQAAAQALFEEGRRLMNAGSLAEACPKFAESQKLDPGAGTLLNLAACYEKNGQTASAWVTYKDAATASLKAGHKDWAQKANGKADALAPNLSKLSIVVPSGSQTNGLEVKRDGAVVGTGELGVAIPVDPGPHVVEANAPGKQRWSSTVQVGKAKDQVSVTIPVLEAEASASTATTPAPATTPAAPAATHDEAPPSGAGNTQRIVGIAVAGVGVVGLALGTVFGLSAKSKRDDAKAFCNDDQSRCQQQGIDLMSDARSSATLSTVAFVAGGVAVAGGLVLFLTAPGKTPTSTNVQVGFTGTGATLRGAW